MSGPWETTGESRVAGIGVDSHLLQYSTNNRIGTVVASMGLRYMMFILYIRLFNKLTNL